MESPYTASSSSPTTPIPQNTTNQQRLSKQASKYLDAGDTSDGDAYHNSVVRKSKLKKGGHVHTPPVGCYDSYSPGGATATPGGNEENDSDDDYCLLLLLLFTCCDFLRRRLLN